MNDTPEPITLDYGVHASAVALRRWARRLVMLLVMALMVAAGWPLYGPYLSQAVYLRRQHAIAHEVLPARTVIYTEDPARLAAVKGMAGYRDSGAQFPASYGPWLPEAWERAYSSDAIKGRDGPYVAGFQVDDTFGYLRTSAGGVPWIVKLEQVNPWQNSNGRRLVSLTQVCFRPAGWTPGALVTTVSYMSKQVRLGSADRITLFAPQPDTTNASRVNIAYEINGQPGLLKAIVTDRGYVDISNDHGPADVVPSNTP